MGISSAHLSAMVAFILWGLLPIYWKLFSEVSAWDLFGHRLMWSFLTLLIICIIKNKFGVIREILKDRRRALLLVLSAGLISSNWLLYIYAINTGKILEASMGYFLNPLINVLMGWILLKEKIRSTQWPAIFLAFIAIVMIGVQSNLQQIPYIALLLSFTFAIYGLIRKLVHVGSLEGLFFETSVIIIPTMIVWHFRPTSPMTVTALIPYWKVILLCLAGIITCTPLILFAYAAKRLTLQSLGFIQYLSPSFKFICGLFIFHEPLAQERLYAFFIIWFALFWYSVESILVLKKNRR